MVSRGTTRMSRKDAAGRPASARPVRPRRTAVETASTAACWPMMRSESVWRRDSSRSRSDCRSLPTGMPVRSETTAAMSCRVRLTVRWARRAASWRRTSVRSSSRSFAACSYCAFATACSSCCSSCCWRSASSAGSGPPSQTCAAPSSSRSSALSGRKRSVR